MTTETLDEAGPNGGLVAFLALAAALGTSTTYLLQPAVADVAEALRTDLGTIGLAFAGGPVGYLVGLVVLVPLVDRHPPSRLLAAAFAALAGTLLLTAVAGDVLLLGVALCVTGAFSAVGAGLSSLAGRMAPVRRRATVLGTVTAGIAGGILAGRIVGGWLSEQLGWRMMLGLVALTCVLVAVCCLRLLPTRPATTEGGLLAGLRALPGLFVRYGELRVASGRGALWFFAFCALWAGLAVALSAPPYSYSAERIGLYALAGLSGLAATRLAGVWTDRVGPRRVILLGLAPAGLAAAASAVALDSPLLVIACLATVDVGLFAAQVANQSTVLAIDPGAPARFNSAYMAVYFVGGSLGTACGALVAEWYGWPPVAALVTAAIGLAAVLSLAGRPVPAGV
ncbi:MFS transporter [Nocardioides carbamazepini]|uniref:MFS transporter n=1 Tax=Nocardioides carbamazepini TaxID=2854259 RepID=UPI00214A4A1A|nr:MFS transporter [Nocardioides carbamazepini]MCR1785382.1 MFS transporter [Nocardioides carbamazepini]